MSYVDTLTEEELKKYTIVEDWNKYFSTVKPFSSFKYDSYSLSNLIIKSSLLFIADKEFSISFYNCYFTEPVLLMEPCFKSISFYKCHFDSSFNISGYFKAMEYLSLETVKIKEDLKWMGGNINKCHVRDFECESVNIAYADFNEAIFDFKSNHKVRFFKIDTQSSSGLIRLNGNDSRVEHLILSGDSKKTSINIDKLRLGSLNINKFRNEIGLKLANFTGDKEYEKPKIYIEESYLGAAELYNADFRGFETINIIDSHLTDCKFINVRWKNNLTSFKGGNNIEDDDYFMRMKENYRQLKFALSKQGDAINEQQFHALEVMAHYKTLSWNNNFWSKIIIWLSWITSNFGHSIWWPIRALLTVHYFLFMFALGIGAFDVNSFDDFIYHFFYLISPLHKSEDIFQGWTIIIDVVMRIWSSYMIYNIIRASRRFIK